jgi:Tol biopolymer transport system component/DNA-binding winged helix-turn-helix (wHTH) protein
MANPAESAHIVRFGDFELDLRTAELRTNGHHIVLQEKPFQILTALLERPGEMVSREELSKRLWPAGTFVDFNLGLNKAVNRLREALDDSAEQPRFIETFPKRGYRFVAPVAEVTRAEAADSQPRDAQGRSLMRRWKLPSAAAVVIVALVAGGIYWRRAHQLTTLTERDTIVLSDFAASPQQPTLRPLTSLAGNVISPTFSPDGKQIAFGWDGETNGAGWDLYVKAMGLDKPRRLTHHPATRLSAAWSPDGRNIVVSRVAGESDTGVYLIPATGGPERQLASASFGSWFGNDISWSPDGKQLAFTDHPPASPLGTELLFLLSLDTLERKPVKTDCKLTETPAFSPHGDLLAWVCVDTWSSVSLHVSRMSDGHTERLLQGIDGIPGIAWSEDGGRIVFSSPWNGDLWETSLSRPGYAQKLPFGHDASDIAVSPAGHRLAYVQGARNVNIWRLDLSGSPPQARKLIVSSREQLAPNFSPDGRKIAFSSNRSGGAEVWVCDADGSNAVQLTSYGILATGMPRWSPDGKLIAFDSRVGGEANIYVVDPNGGVPRKLNIDVHGNNLPSWSRDGRWIYFVHGEDARESAIWKVSSEGGRAVRIAETEATYPLESPDGQYVYFAHKRKLWRVRTDASAEQEVEGMPELQANGDTWVPTGSGIYFLADAKHHTEVDFFDFNSQKVRRVFTLGKSLPGWAGGVSISSDGKWLLYPQLDGSSSDLMMIENWK